MTKQYDINQELGSMGVILARMGVEPGDLASERGARIVEDYATQLGDALLADGEALPIMECRRCGYTNACAICEDGRLERNRAKGE